MGLHGPGVRRHQHDRPQDRAVRHAPRQGLLQVKGATKFRGAQRDTLVFRGFQSRADQQRPPPSARDEAAAATISANAALAFDTVNLLINTFSSLMRKNVNLFVTNRRKAKFKGVEEGVGCGDLSGQGGPNTWEHGQRILQEIKNTSFEGLTGELCQSMCLTTAFYNISETCFCCF